jgi:hypothetical protein
MQVLQSASLQEMRRSQKTQVLGVENVQMQKVDG